VNHLSSALVKTAGFFYTDFAAQHLGIVEMRNVIVGGGRGLVVLTVLSLGVCSWVFAEGATCTVPDPGLRQLLLWKGISPIEGETVLFEREALEAIGYLSWPPEWLCKRCAQRGELLPATEGEGEGEWEGEYHPPVSTPILDLTGLECATNLRQISLTDQPIHDFAPLSGLLQLEFLNLDTPAGIDLSDLSNLTALYSLSVTNTGATEVYSLSELTGLQHLDLRGNSIVDITPLGGLTQLETLRLRRNAVTEVSTLAELHNLKILDIRDNQVGDLSPLAALEYLTILEANGNPITRIDALPPALQFLGLRECGLTSLDGIPAHPPLTGLSLDGNMISDFSGLVRYPALYSLSLGTSGIASLDVLPDSLPVAWLGLADNAITDITRLSGWKQLTHVFLQGNPLDPITACPVLAEMRSHMWSVTCDLDCRETYHSADTNFDTCIGLQELLRVIQFFNSGGYSEALAEWALHSEDGYRAYHRPGWGVNHHSADYAPADWAINLDELLRVIQLFNSGGYVATPGQTEDGYTPSAAEG
jgi:hypothetical protein